MTTLWLVILTASLAVLAYALVGFPVLVAVRAWLFSQPLKLAAQPTELPTVSILIAAYNEEACIAQKLDYLLACDYPHEKLEIVVVSDGSKDRTNEIVNNYPANNVTLVAVDRLGKAGALNAAAPQLSGEIMVFTDANSMFARDALRQLVRPFGDPQVGAVAGDQRYLKSNAEGETAASSGERGYWNYDRWLKRLQSRAGNATSATGAIYAIRRTLFRGAPEGVTDDFAISTDVIEQGHRLFFAARAIAYEPVAKSSQVEFGRKVRVMSRGFRSVLLRWRLLNPFRHGFYALQLFSHKVLRRLLAFPLLGVLISSIALYNAHPVFPWLAGLQVAFYTLAVVPCIVPTRRLNKWLTLPFFICMVYAAATIALFRTLLGGRVTFWETHREAVSDEAEESAAPAAQSSDPSFTEPSSVEATNDDDAATSSHGPLSKQT